MSDAKNKGGGIAFPTAGEAQGAYLFVLTAIIQELKAQKLIDGEALASRIEGLVDEKNANNKAIQLFALIARHKDDDI